MKLATKRRSKTSPRHKPMAWHPKAVGQAARLGFMSASWQGLTLPHPAMQLSSWQEDVAAQQNCHRDLAVTPVTSARKPRCIQQNGHRHRGVEVCSRPHKQQHGQTNDKSTALKNRLGFEHISQCINHACQAPGMRMQSHE